VDAQIDVSGGFTVVRGVAARRDRVSQGLSAVRPRGLTRPRRAPVSRGTRHSTHQRFVAGLGSSGQSMDDAVLCPSGGALFSW
jgi:hypothetical protein